jgi:serine/threonine protein kinase
LELTLGRYPFHSQLQSDDPEDALPLSEFELLHHIINDPVPEMPKEYSDVFKSFIHECLEKDPAKRPTPAYLLEKHPIVKQESKINFDLVGWAQQFLEPNLDEKQIQRWSMTVSRKRESINMAKEKRMSKARVPTSSVEAPLSFLSLKDTPKKAAPAPSSSLGKQFSSK